MLDAETTIVQVNRLLVPETSERTRTGVVLARIGEKYGCKKIGRARLRNDAPISTSAARRGIMPLTIDNRDFDLITEFCPLEYRMTWCSR